MRPSMTRIMMGAARILGEEVAPHLAHQPYAMGHAGTIGLMLIFLAQEAERAAHTLVKEIDAIEQLFASVQTAPLPDDLRAELAAAIERRPASLHVSVLEDHAAMLKDLLITLQVVVELEPAPWARVLEADIWQVLRQSAQDRALYLPVL